MNIYTEPTREQWAELVRRPAFDVTRLFDVVRPIMEAVREQGDEALRAYGFRFDKVELSALEVSPAEMEEASALVPPALKEAIARAYRNVYSFHHMQLSEPSRRLETAPGVLCEQRTLPIWRVGLYVPGGQAPLFSTVLMLAIPAQVAGCGEVVLCTPPGRDGKVHPAILYAARVCGVQRVFKVGGAQAVAAMAYGTESVPKVDKIFGPGNAYVTAAKQLASLSGVAIDMPAGPSEVEVLADTSCVPSFVAADLLSQAEHGPDSQAVLVTTDAAVATAVAAEVEAQLAALPRREIAAQSIANSRIIVLADVQDAIDFTNAYAPEHLIIAMEDAAAVAESAINAGSIFLGNYSCESAGDYASGTNHTLPTMGCVRAYSSLCVDSFQRKLTLQTLSPQGIRSIGRTVECMAQAEKLEAHARAMSLRMQAVASMPEEAHSTTGIAALARPNILALKPYSSARDEYAGKAAHVFLDANECPHNAPFNRYPDPLQWELKQKISAYKGVAPERIFLGNGSDEAIDLIFRTFCTPGVDSVAAIAPSYGMYQVCADINNVEYRKCYLGEDFSFDGESFVQQYGGPQVKVLFLCSPNNPTGNLLPLAEIRKVLDAFHGIVVVDEAYIDFAPACSSAVALLEEYPRLIVLNTFSKAWASAGIRLGMAMAHPEVIALFNKVKYPYNVNVLTQRAAMERLEHMEEIRAWVEEALAERSRMMAAVAALPICRKMYPSEANFFLVQVSEANRIYDALVEQGIIVRNRHRVECCENCLRITIGTPAENDELLTALKQF